MGSVKDSIETLVTLQYRRTNADEHFTKVLDDWKMQSHPPILSDNHFEANVLGPHISQWLRPVRNDVRFSRILLIQIHIL